LKPGETGKENGGPVSRHLPNFSRGLSGASSRGLSGAVGRGNRGTDQQHAEHGRRNTRPTEGTCRCFRLDENFILDYRGTSATGKGRRGRP